MMSFSFFTRASRARRSLIAMFSLMAALAAPALADTAEQASASQDQPTASLQASASQEVAQDWLRITLQAQVSDASRQNVSSELNKQLDQALTTAREHAGQDIRVQSGNYQVWPATDDKGNITTWRGRGDIHLESADFDAVSQLAGELGDDMAVAGMDFSVSPKKRAEIENDLLEEAVQQLLDRASRLATAFGYASYRLREVSLGGGGNQYAPVARQMADASSLKAQSIAVEGGTEVISLSVQGSVYLLDEQ
ncbi:MAG TPA: SIMPL domain-containing protein [Burkholderiaceae bacterium]|nr:SIMPL domain-containing protein [Burkholderiaceae bacterium]